MRKTLLKALPMLFVGLLFALQSIRAQTNYYVDAATGNDANAGTQASPKKTIQAAVDVATGTSIIYISVGSYAENVTIAKSNISLIGSGSGANGNSAPTAPIAASHTIITGGGAGKGIQVSGSRTNVTVRDLAVIGYTEEGFFASSGASNLTVQNLQVNGNCTGSAGRGGIFVAGNALNVTITGNAVQNNGPGATARGIALWDNSKDKITITNNYVVFTSCCGIDLNDGTSSGVNISNNTLIAGSAGSDSGIGVLGMKAGNGANIISGNNITIAKRYGIEIKNPAGSGLDDESADGAIIVKNNIITRSGAFTELRDIAGVAVFRRSFTPGNPSNYIDVPSGVVIKGNTIDGFTQASAEGEGYGIVVEGVRMTIKDNIISNSDIGIQRQAGNSSGYVKNNAGDANQAAAASPYFDRGNSPFSASIILSGNTLTSGNGTQTRDEFAANSYLGDAQFVFNADKKANYATINLGVEYATAGNTLQLSEHTFDELVIVGKSVTIDGLDKTKSKIKYTGVQLHPTDASINIQSITPALLKVMAKDIVVKNLSMDVDLAKISSAIITSGDAGGLQVLNNNITAVASGALYGGYGFRNAIASNISGLGMLGITNASNPDGLITVKDNTISFTAANNPLPAAIFRAAVAVDNYNVLVENNATFAVNHDVTNRFQTTVGQSILRNNVFNGGGIEFSEPNAPFAGAVFEDNNFNYQLGGFPTFALIRFKNNNANKPFVFKNNQVQNHYWLMSLENFQNINVEGNIFSPIKNAANYFQAISINTKTISSSVNTKLPLSATIIGNTFNGASGSVNSKGIAFYNHDNASPQFGEITIGAVGKPNIFNDHITNYLYIDESNGAETKDMTNNGMPGYPEYGLPSSASISRTTTGYWITDIRADQNNFFISGAVRAVASMTQAQRVLLDAKIYDKLDNNNIGKVNYYFPIKNTTTTEGFATIQAAIDDADTQNGHILNVDEGTYTLTGTVKITKGITLQGNSNLALKPIINGVADSPTNGLVEVNAPNVTVSNFEFQIEQTGNAMVGISSTSTDNFNNVTISDNVFKGMKAQSTGMVFESYAIKLGRLSSGPALPKNQVNVLRNVVNYNNMAAPDLFGRGVYAYNVYGKIGGSATDGNTIAAFYALQSGQVGGSADFEFSNNNVQGGVVAIIGADAGNHKIANNDIGSGILLKAQADLLARHLEVRGTRGVSTTIEVSGNTIRNYTNIGAFVQRSNNVTLTGNTFTPFQDNTNDKFNSIVFSSKEGTSSSQSAVMSENLTITANTFNGNASNAGTAIAFWNHNGSGAIKPLMNAKIGGSDTDKNTFSSALGNYITLDATASGTTSSLSAVYGVAQDLTNTTNILPFNSDIDASYNVFGAINTGTETSFDNLLSVKGSIADGIDNPLTGYVNIQPNKAFIGATALLGNALTAVPENFTLVLKDDAAVYGSLGDATVNKAFTFDIDNNAAAEMVFGNLIVNALAKQVTFADKAKATGNFTLTEGKINAPLGFTLDASKTISFNPNKPNNYINGTVTLNGLGAGASETILVGNATTSTAVALTDPTGTTPSNFEITYTGSAPANGTNFNAAVVGVVHNKEFWTITKTGGDIAAKVGLTTFDFTNSGFTSFAPADALMVRFDGTNWVSVGNDGYSVNTSVGAMTSASTTDFGNFTFAKTPLAVLPISLISFSAQATNGGALVKWSTAKEENNATFEVEKSLDGRNFFIIHTKAGKGDASTVSNYEFLDASFKQSAYYRLVDVSVSGKRNPHTALTKFVKGLDASLAVVAYPNPVTTKLFVSVGSANKENVKVSLVDLTGKTLKTKTADSSQPIELDVAGVATGSYILQVIKDSGNVSKKIVKL